jgi:glycosyltransferase involved in cell wall biosynthesis
MPRVVSIILPTYNRLEFLRPAIESVLAQSFTKWEMIIADDGSSAETRAYLAALDDPPRIRVIWLPHSGRPAVARNAALREAQGEYVAFIDSDDIWLPQKLETQIASLRRHSHRKWSYTKFVLMDTSGNPTAWARGGGWPVPDGWIFEKLVKSETVIALPSVVASRELLEQVGGFDPGLVMCEDYDLWLRLAAISEVDAIDEPLTLVTRHGKHYGNEVTSFEDCQRVFDKVLETPGTGSVHSILREKRAEIAVGLASSHAASGNGLAALRTILSSASDCWQYPRWWLGALRTGARSCVPQSAYNLVRKYRSSRHAQGATPP